MKDIHRFCAMTEAEHKAAGHFRDSTNKWIYPDDYIDTYYMDW